jgi:ABC-type bacteriocin/lantibiotic exporter with double-glycine peptidase domain
LRGLLACISALFSFGLMFYFNPWLSIIAFVLASFRGVVVVATGLVRLSHERINFDLQGSLQSLVLQFLTGIAKLRIANATVHALAIWSERFAAQRRQFVASQRAANLLKVLEAAFPGIATMIVFAVAENIAKDTLLRDLGTFLAFIAALGLSIAAIGEWATAAGELLIAIPRFARLRPIIANAPEISTDRKSPGILGGSVELAQVAFRYAPSGPRVLENVSLSVAENEYIAIVGPSGSGKSTIFRLLLGFERPESGVIYFDGKAAETLDISAVRRQIGVVLQNSRTISGSIYENICGGVLLPVDEVWDAVRLVGLDNDINAMPMGLHTVVSEGANTLSGGQRQRLLIARALIHKPKILLMDEATSALDNRTQAIVSSSLASLNVTRIVIAHRLTTVQSADRIIVLAGGKIIQTGNFEELSSKPGMFADFTRRQLL